MLRRSSRLGAFFVALLALLLLSGMIYAGVSMPSNPRSVSRRVDL